MSCPRLVLEGLDGGRLGVPLLSSFQSPAIGTSPSIPNTNFSSSELLRLLLRTISFVVGSKYPTVSNPSLFQSPVSGTIPACPNENGVPAFRAPLNVSLKNHSPVAGLKTPGVSDPLPSQSPVTNTSPLTPKKKKDLEKSNALANWLVTNHCPFLTIPTVSTPSPSQSPVTGRSVAIPNVNGRTST